MALTIARSSAGTSGATLVIPTTSYGMWTTCHSNLSATADSAANLLNPTASGISTSVVPIIVGQAVSKALFRVRYPTAATITTSPIVRLYGAHCSEEQAKAIETAGALDDTGLAPPIRLDNIDSGAAGVTLTLDSTNDIRDGTYKYSDPISLTAMDLLGSKIIWALASTAANISTGTPILQVLLVN